MKLLLDTHSFLWVNSSPAKLSPTSRSLCHDPSNTLLISVASIWELQIKVQLRKIVLGRPLDLIVADQQKNGIQVLPITAEHVFVLDSFPLHHKDPFDRILLAQATVEGAAIVSADQTLRAYAVNVIW